MSWLRSYRCLTVLYVQWTGTCIGARNYPQFLMFVASIFVSALVHLATTAHIALGWVLLGAHTDFYLLRLAVLVVSIPWACMVMFLVGTLLAFHLYLIARGQTTNEYFRERRAQRERAVAAQRNSSETPAAVKPVPVLCLAAQYTVGMCQQRLLRCARLTDSQAPGSAASNTVISLPEDTDPRSPGDIQLVSVTSTEEESLLQSLGGSALRAATDMVITPMYDADATPFPELSPSPFSPLSPSSPLPPAPPHARVSPPGGVHREGIAALRLDLEHGTERAEEALPAFTSVQDTLPEEEKVEDTQNTEPRVHWALPRTESTHRTGGAYTPLPAAPQAETYRSQAADSDGKYAYLCLCVPVVPHSRLLPQWQPHSQADAQQQEELLQELFQHMTAALRREAMLEDEVTV
jgi:hypothetical protein